MRAINEDDVKRLIRAEKRNWTLTQFPGVTEALNHVEGGLVGIRTVESQIPRWISVEDDLPAAVITSCLVYFDGDIYVAEWSRDKYNIDWWFYVGGEYEPLVTHWMPMPELPEEDCQ